MPLRREGFFALWKTCGNLRKSCGKLASPQTPLRPLSQCATQPLGDYDDDESLQIRTGA